MATQLASLDISDDRARFVVFESSLRNSKLMLTETLHRRVDEEAPAFWKRVRGRLPDGLDALVVAADSRTVSMRAVSFPFGDVRKAESALEFELDGLVPYDVEEMATAWHITERGAENVRMLVAMQPKERLQERIDALQEADLEPRSIMLASAAMGELVNAGHVADTDETEVVAVLSMGAARTHLAVHDSGLRNCRTIQVGGDTIDRALARAFDIDFDAAQSAKHGEACLLSEAAALAASPNARKISDTVEHGLAPLLTALVQMFQSLPAESTPARMVITGGSSRLSGLREWLESKLGIPVELLDLQAALAGVDVETPIAPEYAVAVGMGLATIRRGRNVPLNMRRGEFSYGGDLQLYRSELIRMVVGVSVVVVLAIAGMFVRFSVISAEEARLDESMMAATKKIVGREIRDPTAALAALKSTPSQAGDFVIPDYSAPDLFEMMSKAIAQTTDVQFQNLEFKTSIGTDEPDRITGKGHASNFETTDKLISEMKKDPCVLDVEVSKQRKNRDERVEFQFLAKVACAPGRKPGTDLAQVAVAAMPTAAAAGAVSPDTPPSTGPNDTVKPSPVPPRTPSAAPPQPNRRTGPEGASRAPMMRPPAGRRGKLTDKMKLEGARPRGIMPPRRGPFRSPLRPVELKPKGAATPGARQQPASEEQ